MQVLKQDYSYICPSRVKTEVPSRKDSAGLDSSQMIEPFPLALRE